MKNISYLSVIALILMLCTSCKKEKFDFKTDFEKSSAAWKTFKAKSGNSYVYQVSTSSWTNYQTFTTITVTNGQITGRDYMARSTEYHPSAAVTIHEQWNEGQQTLNTHTSGAASITLDEIYEQARTVWLKKRSDADTYFKAENDGLISSCGFVPHGCQDDCFTGIHIEFIRTLTAEAF